MNIVVISQADRLEELKVFLPSVLREGEESCVLICPHKKFVKNLSLGQKCRVVEFLPPFRYRLLLGQLYFSFLRLRFVRVLRNGSSVGALAEKVIRYGLSFFHRERTLETQSGFEAETCRSTATVEVWKSKYHQKLEDSITKIFEGSKIQKVYVFDLIDAPLVFGVCQKQGINVSML